MPFCWTGPALVGHCTRMAMLFALLACWFAGSPSWAAAAVERVDVAPDHITIRFDRSVAEASSFVIGTPERIAIDVAGAAPGGRVRASELVAGVRQSTYGSGARIVFDLSRPAVVTDGSFDSEGRNLTLAIRTVDDAAFARAAGEGRLRFLPPFSWASATAARPAYSVSIPVPAAQPHAVAAPRIRQRFEPAAGGDRRRPRRPRPRRDRR